MATANLNDSLTTPARKTFIVDPKGLTDIASRIELFVSDVDFVEDIQPDPDTPKPKRKRTKTATSEPIISDEPYLILGFDTEFKTPKPVTLPELRGTVAREDERVRYTVLSYQFHGIMTDGIEWGGIALPAGPERLSISEFVLFALASGARQHGIKKMPREIYLVGHFARADVPAFSDFKLINDRLDAIRGTFTTAFNPLKIAFTTGDGEDINIRVHLRDTMLLTPQSSRSLKELGKLVKVEKVELDADKKKAHDMITNMDRVRSENWELFKRYAMTDAIICAKYLQRVIDIYQTATKTIKTGSAKVPLTLSSIGVELLQNFWLAEKFNKLEVVGKQIHLSKTFNKAKNTSVYRNVEVNNETLHLYVDLITECYHGGRNEQFWFGPGFEDDWNDFDLAGAYPTSMSLIREADWDDARRPESVDEFKPQTLGFAWVEFEFPESVRYPTMPIAHDGNVVFPRSGRSYCAAPEIYLAKQLGAKLKILNGVIIPQTDKRIFTGFIKDCIQKRYAADKKSLEGLFWKEVSNSTYGKLAQGLKERRLYNIRERGTKALPPSKITNAAFAAFTTSFTRAVLGDLMNAVPKDKMVFSCTTDGFITNASYMHLLRYARKSEFGRLYAAERIELLGNINEPWLESKHGIRRPLGWRTRGQATLVDGPIGSQDDPEKMDKPLLAKAGIYTPMEFEDPEDMNEEIVRKFFTRTPTSTIEVFGLAGLRDIVEHDTDLVETFLEKRLNMEYDMKRRPSALTTSAKYNHIAFDTAPWESTEQYMVVRHLWQEYNKKTIQCLRTKAEYQAWARFLTTKTMAAGSAVRTGLHKKDGDKTRLRKMLCVAFKGDFSEVGLNEVRDLMTSQQFADLLSSVGIQCSKQNVDNGKTQEFERRTCLPTVSVLLALEKLQKAIPTLNVDEFLYVEPDVDDAINLNNLPSNQFLDNVT